MTGFLSPENWIGELPARVRTVDVPAGMTFKRMGEPPDGLFRVPISHTDIAEHLEVTRQALQREMSAMSDAGILQKRAGRWCLKAPDSMRPDRTVRSAVARP
ncbi:helix-turn-helix domain-containing protein [Steroidobacter flavus]|uniref:Helix-turn-helix domain-containing protein n=1 Tax=Steroidobacter flavus TaxID=1842136 RepID=A0ABV8SW57_9GAMM